MTTLDGFEIIAWHASEGGYQAVWIKKDGEIFNFYVENENTRIFYVERIK